MKVALCYDRINKFGGAERVLIALHELWPHADVFTLSYDLKKASWANGWKLRHSFLQKIPLIGQKHELFPPLAPYAWRRFSFDEYDLVFSVTSAEAKSIQVSGKTKHICYCLTPTRYFWSGYFEYLYRPGFGLFNGIIRFFLSLLSYVLRIVDFYAAQTPHQLIGISDEVCNRIFTFYRRKSIKIYPPVDYLEENVFSPIHREKVPYFLVVSRLVPYKHIDIVVGVCSKYNLPLKVVGTGNQMNSLINRAGKTVEFLGFKSDPEVAELYRHCTAFIFPTFEDFGIAPVEAQLYGRPVIAYRSGGATETVIDGKTGIFFDAQTNESLEALLKKVCNDKEITIERLHAYFSSFSTEACTTNALRFSKSHFKSQISELVGQVLV